VTTASTATGVRDPGARDTVHSDGTTSTTAVAANATGSSGPLTAATASEEECRGVDSRHRLADAERTPDCGCKPGHALADSARPSTRTAASAPGTTATSRPGGTTVSTATTGVSLRSVNGCPGIKVGSARRTSTRTTIERILTRKRCAAAATTLGDERAEGTVTTALAPVAEVVGPPDSSHSPCTYENLMRGTGS
jgi:hypothetical protein